MLVPSAITASKVGGNLVEFAAVLDIEDVAIQLLLGERLVALELHADLASVLFEERNADTSEKAKTLANEHASILGVQRSDGSEW